jgi:hypothetical protein
MRRGWTPTEALSADEEDELYRHYDIDYTAVRDRLGDTAVDVIR